ncbi:Calcium-dependent protein kinase 17 [Hibiscus syriacus]|uniref:non-specific serine/threonine protein kinase n=1 Tax=Hibiscus syriacus TaxID=106335 RepID=A0A6A2XNZ0_HIBSY|nr:Calcium-dependent protein kinase 17 [Hibiscus syriacus]
MPSGRPCRSPCPLGDLVGRHALRATYPRSASLGFPRIARSVVLGCPRIARSDGLGRMASVGWPRMLSDGLGCSRMASVGWPQMPSVLGRAWHMQSLVARREDMATYRKRNGESGDNTENSTVLGGTRNENPTCSNSQQTSYKTVPSSSQGGASVTMGGAIGLVLGQPMEDVKATYSIGNELGRGQFGVTYLCTNKATGEQFACKTIAKRKLVNEEDREDVRRESVHLVMELCRDGEMFDRIIAKGHYTECAAAALLRRIVQIVHTFHSMGVIHRDIKPENFLLLSKEESSPLKATDFGLSIFFKPGQVFKDIVGSAYYIAPEVLKGRYGPEADIWSLGVILYILLSGSPPFWAASEDHEERNNKESNAPESSEVPETVEEEVEIQGTNGKMQSDFGVHKKDKTESMLALLAGNNKSLRTQLDRRALLENTSGSKVGRIQLFDMTHMKKDGTPMTDKAVEIMEKLREKRAEYHVTSSSQGLVDDDDIENRVINDVLGPERYGRVRCQGSFVTPTKYFGSSSSQYTSSQSQSSQLEVSRLKQKLVDMDQQMANMKAENEAREAATTQRENRKPGYSKQYRGHVDFSSKPWPMISPQANDLVKKMLNSNPSARLTAAQVLSHQWVKEDGEAPDTLLDNAVLSRLRQFKAMNQFKKVALKVIAGCLSEEEIKGLKVMFKGMDTDNSGTITLEELKQRLAKHGTKISEYEVKQLMEAADTDRNGTIDYEEFITATMHMNRMDREDHLYHAFQHFDKDNSGSLIFIKLITRLSSKP